MPCAFDLLAWFDSRTYPVQTLHQQSFYPTAQFPFNFIAVIDRLETLRTIRRNFYFSPIHTSFDRMPHDDLSPPTPITYPLPCLLMLRTLPPRLLALKLASSLGVGPVGTLYSCIIAESAAGAALLGTATVDTAPDRLPRAPLREGPQPPARARRVAFVSNVAVAPAARRRGVASALMLEAEARAAAWKSRGVALHCLSRDTGALGLYRRLGYRRVGVEPLWRQLIEMRPSPLLLLYKALPAPPEEEVGAALRTGGAGVVAGREQQQQQQRR